jgi:hypothetical protein
MTQCGETVAELVAKPFTADFADGADGFNHAAFIREISAIRGQKLFR